MYASVLTERAVAGWRDSQEQFRFLD